MVAIGVGAVIVVKVVTTTSARIRAGGMRPIPLVVAHGIDRGET